jgi:hypothetical protein
MTYALINLGHRERNPRADHASLRILGIFDTLSEARDHSSLHPYDVDLFAVKCGEPFVCMTSLGNDESAHLEKLMRDNKNSVADHVREFNEHMSTGTAGDNIMPNESESMPVMKDTTMMASSVTKTSEISGQAAAIISIIKDVSSSNLSEQQPGFIVWGAWPSVDEARTHVRSTMAPNDQKMTFDVVVLYQWLCPSKIDLNNVEEEFHDGELTKIIAHRKSEGAKVSQYKTLCEGKGVEPCLHDIDKKLIFGDHEAVDPSIVFGKVIDPIESSSMASPL